MPSGRPTRSHDEMLPMTDFAVLLEAALTGHRARVNSALHQYLAFDDDCPTVLREAIQYSVMAGGKRLRPVLVLMACEACGGDVDRAIPAACAIEMVHTYSLIHDDLPAMDDDKLRRGRPTNHIVFGEAHAILAGDALLALAFEILGRDVDPPEVAAACCVDLASAAGASGMVGGQVADLESESREAGDTNINTAEDLELLQSIHRRKTGQLLLSALTMGARIADADHATLDAVRDYGKCVGLAFQIADDLLDTSGDASKMGKGTQKDSGRGKLTYPGLLGGDESRRRAKELIDEACHSIHRLGERANCLEALAHFVIERDH
jgi:geranylgeranyl diphosphate synthase type II